MMVSILLALIVISLGLIIVTYELDERKHARYERAVYMQQLEAQRQHAESEWIRKNYEYKTRGYYND